MTTSTTRINAPAVWRFIGIFASGVALHLKNDPRSGFCHSAGYAGTWAADSAPLDGRGAALSAGEPLGLEAQEKKG